MIFTFHCEIFSGKEAGAKSSKDSLVHFAGRVAKCQISYQCFKNLVQVFLITWTPYNVLAVMKAILGAEHEVMQKTWFDKMLTYPVQSLGDNPLPKCMFFTHCKNGLSSPTPSILHLLFKSYTQFWASIISQHSRKLATYICSSIPQSFFVGD